MKRDYKDGVQDDVTFFFGKEVEHTPAFGLDTMFVTGVHSIWEIKDHLSETTNTINHIFFGANHSFNPKGFEEWKAWEDMIKAFLDQGYYCSLDIPLSVAEEFLDTSLCEYNTFIPQIRVPIPFTKLWNYNTMLKIDDKGFNQTNPGVWSHRLHTLMDPTVFTPWTAYKGDTPL